MALDPTTQTLLSTCTHVYIKNVMATVIDMIAPDKSKTHDASSASSSSLTTITTSTDCTSRLPYPIPRADQT